MDRAVAFWGRLLGAAPRDRNILDGPGVARLVGYPGARIERCWLDLPGGVALELLRYTEPVAPPYGEGTAHPGNVHVCLLVDDVDEARRHALACGARPVGGPIEVRAGPTAGAGIAYVRDPDGVTIELFRPPRAGGASEGGDGGGNSAGGFPEGGVSGGNSGDRTPRG